MKFAIALGAVLLLPLAASPITINTVPVGNKGNFGEIQGSNIFGAVAYDYRIGTTEITNAQYVTFLNAVAASDPYGLYDTTMGFSTHGGITRSGASGTYTYSVKADVTNVPPGNTTYTYADKPVVYVSWYDAIRFANWVNNGATAGAPTETGAYTILGGTAVPSNGNSIARNTGSLWFLPSENEWYKAAYHKNDGATGNYWDYPTATDGTPNNNLPSADTGNSANFCLGTCFADADYTTQNQDYPMTSAGAYTLSKSSYLTQDQGGNVWEWNEALVTSTTRGSRGGAFNAASSTLMASNRGSSSAAFGNDTIGFRLATIAVPGDYNVNGIVDAADYVLWRKNVGTSVTLPNDATSGTSLADYDVWRAHFGQTPATATPGAGASLFQNAVPEPSIFAILGAFIFLSLAAANRVQSRSCRHLPTRSPHAR